MSEMKLTRRHLLKSSMGVASTLAMPAIFPGAAWASYSTNFTNSPRDDEVTLGLVSDGQGPYKDIGMEALRGVQLAISHLNAGKGGMLDTFSSKALKGKGILGRKARMSWLDSKGQTGVMVQAAKQQIAQHGATMLYGGNISRGAAAMQGRAHEAGVIHMTGVDPSNNITIRDRMASVFRFASNNKMLGLTLLQTLSAQYGANRRVYHLTLDTKDGWEKEQSIEHMTNLLGWTTVNRVRVPVGTTNFHQHVALISNSGADMLVLNFTGSDLVNVLKSMFVLQGQMLHGRKFEIVVPNLSLLEAHAAGVGAQGMITVADWHWSLPDAGSRAFTNAYFTQNNLYPTQVAHNAYCQILLYADAVARAKSFHPCAVAAALEGFEFDGLGTGISRFRAEDHQCFKSAVILRGKEKPAHRFDYFEVIATVQPQLIEYPFEGLGNLGKCNAGR